MPHFAAAVIEAAPPPPAPTRWGGAAWRKANRAAYNATAAAWRAANRERYNAWYRQYLRRRAALKANADA